LATACHRAYEVVDGREILDILAMASHCGCPASLGQPNDVEVVSVPLVVMPAAGHAKRLGTGLRIVDGNPDSPSCVLKAVDGTEQEVYERLWSPLYGEDAMRSVVPSFCGLLQEDGGFLRLENLTHGFCCAKVMDVKLGVRTFRETESRATKPRPDMFQRAQELFPSLLTNAECDTQSMTKYRYLSLRDAVATTGTLGYRIEGVSGYSAHDMSLAEASINEASTMQDTVGLFEAFVRVAASGEGMANDHRSALLAEDVRRQLQYMRDALATSSFVAQHEFIGTSVLFIADAAGSVRVAWIDFAKSHALPAGLEVTHQRPWEHGNSEDGIILGLDNMLRAWSLVLKNFGSIKR